MLYLKLFLMFYNYLLIAWRNFTKRKAYAGINIFLSYELYLLSIIIVAMIAFSTVGYRSIKAAWSNPVHALKSE